jgi:hypothetical protein
LGKELDIFEYPSGFAMPANPLPYLEYGTMSQHPAHFTCVPQGVLSQSQICQVFLLFSIWSKYDHRAYFILNLTMNFLTVDISAHTEYVT